jgi:hypothetical protein
MLSLTLILLLSQAGDASALPSDAPTKPAVELNDSEAPTHSARLFSEPRVGTGALLGRVGMSLLFGGGAAALGGAMMVAAAYGVRSTPVLVIGAVLTAGLIGLGSALGAAMFGNNYGRDFLDAFVVAMVTAVAGLGLFTIGYFVPALVYPLLAVGVGVTVVGVPLFVQAFKLPEGPEPSFAVLRF